MIASNRSSSPHVASARDRFAAWAATHVSCSDAVVLEATANAWVLYDQLTRLSGSVTVAHPLAIKLISAARVKTDARDTIKLARLLAAHLIPAVWVPPVAVREVRALVTHRKRLVKQRSQARNRVPGVLQRHNLSAKDGRCLYAKGSCLVALAPAFSCGAAARPAGSRAVRNA